MTKPRGQVLLPKVQGHFVALNTTEAAIELSGLREIISLIKLSKSSFDVNPGKLNRLKYIRGCQTYFLAGQISVKNCIAGRTKKFGFKSDIIDINFSCFPSTIMSK